MQKDIEVVDPRGYVVRCPREFWEGKILRHHPELEGCETFVEDAVRSPTYDCIFLSSRRPDRHIYYGRLRGRVEVKVVVQFDSQQNGFIVSASPVSNRAPGEKLLWRK